MGLADQTREKDTYPFQPFPSYQVQLVLVVEKQSANQTKMSHPVSLGVHMGYSVQERWGIIITCSYYAQNRHTCGSIDNQDMKIQWKVRIIRLSISQWVHSDGCIGYRIKSDVDRAHSLFNILMRNSNDTKFNLQPICWAYQIARILQTTRWQIHIEYDVAAIT